MVHCLLASLDLSKIMADFSIPGDASVIKIVYALSYTYQPRAHASSRSCHYWLPPFRVEERHEVLRNWSVKRSNVPITVHDLSEERQEFVRLWTGGAMLQVLNLRDGKVGNDGTRTRDLLRDRQAF
jgi:hypothetical protein